MDDNTETMTTQQYIRKHLRYLVMAASVMNAIQEVALPNGRMISLDGTVTPALALALKLQLAEEVIRELLIGSDITEEEVRNVIDAENREIEMMRRLAMS
jgi:hypothetical protein